MPPLERAAKIAALIQAERAAQEANGKSAAEAAAIAAEEAQHYERQSDQWIDDEYERHVLGNDMLPLR